MRKFILIFILLFIGIFLIPLGILMIIFVLPFDKKRVSGSWFTTVWSWPLIYLNPGCTLKVEGRENINKKKTYIVVANHNAMIDIPMIQMIGINIRWVSKQSLVYFPMVGFVLLLQNAILLKRGDATSAKKMLEKGVRLLKKGVNVAIFPEGTRGETNVIGDFKPGAFLMAKQADVDVLPVLLYNSKKSESSKGRVKLKVKILPPQKIGDQRLSIFSKELNDMYRKEFDKEE